MIKIVLGGVAGFFIANRFEGAFDTKLKTDKAEHVLFHIGGQTITTGQIVGASVGAYLASKFL